MEDVKTFTIINENGVKKVFQILFVFQDEKTNRNYIVYTDRKFHSDGSLSVFANRYDGEVADLDFSEIETAQEWEGIENTLNLLEEDGSLAGRYQYAFSREQNEDVARMESISKLSSPTDYTILAMFTNTLTKDVYVIVSSELEADLQESEYEVGKVIEYDAGKNPSMFQEISDPDEWSSIHDMVSEILQEFEENLSA